MQYTSTHAPKKDQDEDKVRSIFEDIGKKARASGRMDIIMALDRVPGLILGPINTVSENDIKKSITDSMISFQDIVKKLSNK